MTSLSVNGQSQVPPGFRFHPTEEELLHYYLKKKVAYEKIDLDVIRDVDLNKLEPWDIQEKCKIGSTPQNDWYFFSHKDKKYPTGTRTNRATAAGFWKATGRDKVIYSSFKRIGMRKTLVFYKGRAPHGQKSDWIMHEYRLDENTSSDASAVPVTVANSMGDAAQEDGWVVCRVFKKKNHHHKSFDNSNNATFGSNVNSDEALDQILQYMGRTCKKESDHNHHHHHHHQIAGTNMINNSGTSTNNNNMRYTQRPYDMSMMSDGALVQERFMPLPALDSPTALPSLYDQHQQQPSCSTTTNNQINNIANSEGSINTSQGTGIYSNAGAGDQTGFSDWATLDRLVATQLNGQSDSTKQLGCSFNDPINLQFGSSHEHYLQLPQVRPVAPNRLFHGSSHQDYNSEIDLWNFTRSSSSSSDPLCHMSNSSV